MPANSYKELSAEKQAAVNAKIIAGFAQNEEKLTRYSEELRKVPDPQQRAQTFQQMLDKDRDTLAACADEMTYSKTEGLSGGKNVLREIGKTLVKNVDLNASDYALKQMQGIVDSLRVQHNYGKEKIGLTFPSGVSGGCDASAASPAHPPAPPQNQDASRSH